MAKATATCTCATCGGKFEKVTFKPNRTQADSWKEWAEANIDECPTCYAARMLAEAYEKTTAYNLPTVSGQSDKQIAYALDLRAKYVSRHTDVIKTIQRGMSRRSDKAFCNKLAARGMTFDQALKDSIKAHGWETEYICLTSTSAKDIIDALK